MLEYVTSGERDPGVTLHALLVHEDRALLGRLRARLEAAPGRPVALEQVAEIEQAAATLADARCDVVVLPLGPDPAIALMHLRFLAGRAADVPVVALADAGDTRLVVRVLSIHPRACVVRSNDGEALARTVRQVVARQAHWSRHSQAPGGPPGEPADEVEESASVASLLDRNADGMLMADASGIVLYANPAALDLLGRPPERTVGWPLGLPLHAGQVHDVDVSGERRAEMRVVEGMWGDAPALLVCLRDVTEWREAEARAEDLAARLQELTSRLSALEHLDPLTELLNRRGLEVELLREVEQAERTGTSLVALLVDFDDFSAVNRSLGHAVGDTVLRSLAHQMRACLRPGDHVGRVGGDQFLVLLPGTRLAEGVQVAERIRLAIFDGALPIAAAESRVTVTLSAELLPVGLSSLEEVLVYCRGSLDRSKDGGKNRVGTFGERGALGSGIEVASHSLSDLLRDGTCLRTFGQPIMRLSDETIVGYELLSRGPQGLFESPAHFFRVSIDEDILTLVDMNCLRACLAASMVFGEGIRRHVNVFPSTVLDTPIERLIASFPAGASPGSYCLELSEQQFIGEPEYLRAPVTALKEAGIRVALDDVGFGRSSLEALIVLEPDVVKIDRKYVDGIHRRPAKLRALRRLVTAAQALRAEVIAEGIECREDLLALRELGVDFGHGFLWGRPGPVEEVAAAGVAAGAPARRVGLVAAPLERIQ